MHFRDEPANTVRQHYHEAQRYAMEKATNTIRTTRLWDFDRHSEQSREQLSHDRYSRCTRADARLRGVWLTLREHGPKGTRPSEEGGPSAPTGFGELIA